MIPASFEYSVAGSVEEAVAALAQRENARLLAGGQSLLPLLKLRAARPGLLVDIGRISGLRGITIDGATVTIRALTTSRDIEVSEELRHLLPIMRQAADLLADPAVRGRGTFCGSLAFADPAGDWPAVALALNATVHATGPSGARALPIDDFFIAPMRTALTRDEIVTHVTIPIPPPATRMAYLKLRHPASGYALTGVAAVFTVSDEGICTDSRVAITGAGPTAARALDTERRLLGEPLTNEVITEAASLAADGMPMLSDIYADEGYRRHLVRVQVRRSLRAAMRLQAENRAPIR